jgi:hypothetical protein
MGCGASKLVGFLLHAPHILLDGAILIGRLVLGLTARCLGGCDAGFLVGRM